MQQFLQIRGVIFDSVMMEQVPDDGPIGATAVGNTDRDLDAELLGQRRLDGCLPGPAAGQQRAVDIEQTNIHDEIIEGYQGVMPPLTHSVWPVTKDASSLAK